MTENKSLEGILLAMSEYHTGSGEEAKAAIAAIYDAGMMIVDQTRAQPKYKRVDLDEMKKPYAEFCECGGSTREECDARIGGYNRSIDDIKSKYGDLYVVIEK